MEYPYSALADVLALDTTQNSLEDYNKVLALAVRSYLVHKVGKYRASTDKQITHTVSIPGLSGSLLPNKGGEWSPMDLSELIDSHNQEAYIDFLNWMASTSFDHGCISERTHPGRTTIRFFMDFDGKRRNGLETPSVSDMEELLTEFGRDWGIPRQEWTILSRHNPHPSTLAGEITKVGYHVIYPNMIFCTSDPIDWTSLKNWWQAKLKSTCLSLDVECTKRGSLRMAYQKNVADGSCYTLSHYSDGTTVTNFDYGSRRVALLMTSLHLTTQARNPISFPLRPPNSITVKKEEEVESPQPESFVLSTIKMNDVSHFQGMRQAGFYGKDFQLDEREPVDIIDLLMEIQTHVREKFSDKQLGWCPTQEDLDVAIVEIMNRHFAYIQSENSVLQRSFDLVTRKTVWRTTPKNMFLTCYPNLRWQTTIDRRKDGDGNMKSSKQKVTKHIPKIWIEHAACRSYHSVVFAPYPMGDRKSVV